MEGCVRFDFKLSSLEIISTLSNMSLDSPVLVYFSSYQLSWYSKVVNGVFPSSGVSDVTCTKQLF